MKLIAAAKTKKKARAENKMHKKENISPDQLHFSSKVLEFKDLSAQYCHLIESHNKFTLSDFLYSCLDILPDLYKKAMTLPDFSPTKEGIPERSISNQEWGNIFGSISIKLGNYDMYTEVFDPIFPEKDDPIQSSLSDDLSDIYRDLKNGLIYWDTDEPTRYEDAVWEWSFNFTTHWGQHLVSAFRAIHFIVFDHLNDD